MTNSSSSGTYRVGVGPATNLFHAVRFAADRRGPLNLAVTINWHRLGLSDCDATAAFRALRRKLRRRWTHLRNAHGLALGTFDDVGSHENPDGKRNTHWLIRVPAFHIEAFSADLSRFLKKVVKVGDLGQAVHVQPVGAAGIYAKYLLKGIDPRFADYFRMRPVAQGFIEGRGRTFVGRAISQSSRTKVGWKRQRRSSESSPGAT